MSLNSEIVKKVDIPHSLPDLTTMTSLEGSVLLKDVTARADRIYVEGDLLWRGYFPVADREGDVECLWEGAEYFTQEITLEGLRAGEGVRLDPDVASVRADKLESDSCHLVFDIRWQEGGLEQTFAAADDATWTAEPPVVEVAVPIETVQVDDDVVAEEIVTGSFEEEVDRIEENWREKWEALKAAAPLPMEEPIPEREAEAAAEEEISMQPPPVASQAEATVVAAQEEVSEELAPTAEEAEDATRGQEDTGKESPSYCLKYYRVQEGEDLNIIAERLSASISKIKEINTLAPDEDGLGVKVDVGQLLRVPTG